MLQENEFRPETIESIKIEKYSFEDGLQKTIDEIEEIAKRKKIVTIALIASGTDVVKTYFRGEVGRKVREHNVGFVAAEKSEHLEDEKNNIDFELNFYKNGVVIFFENEFGGLHANSNKIILENHQRNMAKQAKDLELPIDRFDLIIALSRPDKPFSIDPNDFADIAIENEGAFDKKR